ncbi:hypothetical protein SSTU70S_07110 [Stutzerimonas stutzeri]
MNSFQCATGEPAQPDAQPSSDAVDRAAFTEKGTPRFTRTVLALFAGGFATFALLYCVQPLMPMLSQAFAINAAQSSLVLSSSTITLAIGLLITGPISDAVGRKPVMVTALLAAALFTLLSAVMPGWHGVLLMRALVGLALQRAGGGGDDLPERGDRSTAPRPGDGPVHRRQCDRRHERPADQRRAGRFPVVAERTGGDGRAGAVGRTAVLALSARIAALPRAPIASARAGAGLHHALSRRWPAVAVPAGVPADGQFRHAVQLHRLPVDRRAVRKLGQTLVGLLAVVYLFGASAARRQAGGAGRPDRAGARCSGR